MDIHSITDLDPINGWFKIPNKKKSDFQHILNVLNKYYESINKTDNTLLEFRKNLCKKKKSEFDVYLKKIDKYVFLTQIKLKNIPIDTNHKWIHIDGIEEEKDKFKSLGNTDHPVFSIVCLTDIFLQSTRINQNQLNNLL